MRRISRLLALLAAIGAGCDSDRNHRPAAINVDTLPSGEVVVVNPDPRAVSGEERDVVIDVRIGSHSGEDAFGRVQAIAVDQQDRIWVLDSHWKAIHVYGSDGRKVRTVGRAGAGPGEFARPVRLDVSPTGDIWVMDPGNGRLSVFDTTGALVSEYRGPAGFWMSPWPGGFDAAGQYYSPSTLRREGRRAVVLRYDEKFQPIDTFDVPTDPSPTEPFVIRAPDGRVRASANVPYSGKLVWRIGRNGSMWVLLTSEYRIFELGPRGDTLRMIRRTFTPLAVTDEDRAAAREALEWFTQAGGRVDWSRVPEYKPLAETFFFDDAGRIWVAINPPDDLPGDEYEIYDADGRYVGAVTVPLDLSDNPAPIIRDGMLYGVTTDSLDVQYVVVGHIVVRQRQ